MYGIDFIDLDYGLIGTHYSIGASGTAHGGKVGYMLMRFLKDGKPRVETLKNEKPEYMQPAEVIYKPTGEKGTPVENAFPPGHYTFSPVPLGKEF